MEARIPNQAAKTALQERSAGLWTAVRDRFRKGTKRRDAKELIGLVAQSRDRWLQSGNRVELDVAISYAQQAVDAVPSGHPDRVELLKVLWTGFFTRFRNLSRIEDLDLAIRCEEEALELIQDHPSTIQHFKEIGVGFYLRYQMKNTLSDLDQAIMCGETSVVASSEEQNMEYHKQLGSVAVRLSERYTRRNELEDLDQSIVYIQEAVDNVPDGDFNLPSYLDIMVVNLGLRYDRKQQEDDLNRAVSLGRQLLDAVTVDDPDRPSYYTNVGNIFHTLFLAKGHIEDLDQAIACGHEALESTQTNHRHYANHVGSLGIRYRTLYRRSGQFSDLEKALEYLNMATGTVGHGVGDARHLANQAMVLHDIYQINGRDTYLDQAISHGTNAFKSLVNPRERMHCLNLLSLAYLDRFERGGLEIDLETAEEYAQQALQELPQDNTNSATISSILGNISRWQFQKKGALSDIDDAIAHGEQSLANSSKDNPAYADYLINFASSLMSRFGRTGHKADLEKAIRHCEAAVDSTPRGAPKGAEYLAVLSSALGLRLRRDGRIEDLDEAINHSEQALQTLPKSHVYRPRYMSHLAQLYRIRFKRERKDSDLQLAIQNHHHALDAVSEEHTDHMMFLSGMSLVCQLSYEHTGDETSLSDAIHYVNRAIDASSKEDPERAQFFNQLGNLLFERCRSLSTWEGENLLGSSQAYLQALTCSTAFPLDRVLGGYRAASNLATIEDYAGADKVLAQTLELVPRITSPTNSRDDLQYVLPKLFGLGILAASVFYRSRRSPVEAIYALEDCHGIISSITMNARSNTNLLKEKHPDLWSHHTQLQNEIGNLQLTNPSLRPGSRIGQSHLAMHKKLQQLHNDLDDVRNKIRSRPGFTRFLLSPSEADMRKLARNGYIVCLNSSTISSEAFLVTPERIWVVPLPDLLIEDTEVLSPRLARNGNPSRRDAAVIDDGEDEEYLPPLNIPEQLELLWTAAVKPILQELGLLCDSHQFKDVKSLPRVWWVGRGKMGFAPLHAAGDHTLGSTENTLSHVLSSYAPSMKALQFIQEKPHRFKRHIKHKMMLVSMPTTPGHDDLNVRDEVSAICKSVQPWVSLSSLEYPSKQDVLSALKTCTIAHFACHGAADRVNPAKSALLLGQKNVTQIRSSIEKLTVEDLDGISSSCAQIIYLSACSTAENKTKYLVDEDIHLAGSFQLLGFPHVICTLWGADDDASVQVARSFYEGLGLCDEDSNRTIAETLHAAILRYRNAGDNWKEFLKWAAFIHLGC